MSTALFVISYLPMLVKAGRSRDLSSYSVGNLLIANVGNLVHSVYVFSLPFGPIWFLHIFYLLSTALMLCWWWRYHWLPSRQARRTSMPAGPLASSRAPAGSRPLSSSRPSPPG